MRRLKKITKWPAQMPANGFTRGSGWRKICWKHAHFYMVYMLHGSHMSCIMSGIGSGRWAVDGGGCQKKRRGLCPTSIINIESRASTSNEKCANKCGWIVGDGVENVLGACRMGEWVFPLTLEHVCSMAFHAHTPFDIKIKMAMGPSSLGHD